MNKKYLIFVILPLFGCALTLISPGLNSNYRLNKTATIRFQEAAFYGSTFYDQSAFFLEFENLKEIIKDPNNATFNKGDILKIDQFNPKNVNLLYEFCFDKDKDIDIFEDIKYYQFKLNDNPPISIVSYFYPYSYFYRGGFVRKNKPYYINDIHPYNQDILKTGIDFQMCVRNIISFIPSSQKNKNILEIITPRNLIINFIYDFDKNFVLYKNEEMEFSAK